MKSEDFSIRSIELTHEQAIDLKIACVNAIENYGIENFEIRETEIEVANEEEEPIVVYVTCETFTEYGIAEQPFDPDILERSVNVQIQLINRIGDIVDWKVLGERHIGENKNWFTGTPIDIEEEIKKQFEI